MSPHKLIRLASKAIALQRDGPTVGIGGYEEKKNYLFKHISKDWNKKIKESY